MTDDELLDGLRRLCERYGDNEPGAHVYSAATTKDQAQLAVARDGGSTGISIGGGERAGWRDQLPEGGFPGA